MALKAGGLDRQHFWRITMDEQTSRRTRMSEVATEVQEWTEKSGQTRSNGIARTRIDGPAVSAESSDKYSLNFTTRNSYKGE